MLNELFDMKLTKFSNLCKKCFFQKNVLEKYESKLKKVKIIQLLYLKNNQYRNL